MTVLITLTTAGSNTGPFNIYSNIDNYTTAFVTGVATSALVAGYTSSLAPDGTTNVLVRSTGACIRDLYLPVSGAPTTTTTSTSSTTSTSTTIAPIVPSISLGSPSCKNNNCNDNAACSVVYGITVNNPPAGSYITMSTGFPSSTASVYVTSSNPATGKLTYYEPSGSATPVYFTLELRNSGGTIIASSSTSLTHQSFWPMLPNC